MDNHRARADWEDLDNLLLLRLGIPSSRQTARALAGREKRLQGPLHLVGGRIGNLRDCAATCPASSLGPISPWWDDADIGTTCDSQVGGSYVLD